MRGAMIFYDTFFTKRSIIASTRFAADARVLNCMNLNRMKEPLVACSPPHEYSCVAFARVAFRLAATLGCGKNFNGTLILMAAPLSTRVTNHLANERTFLAWLRTAIAMMGFGVLIVRLRSSVPPASIPPGAGRGPIHVAQIGLLFALIGLAMVGFALWNYMATRRAIDNDSYRAAGMGIVVFASLILLLGVFVVIYLFTVAPLPALPNGF